jgi:DNA invertase Pin-like site-specific DNA recombinase
LEVRLSTLLVGYARCSTDQQDLTAQRDALASLGVEDDRIYVDHGLTGTNRERPGLREALAACRAGDTLVVTKLDRLARSLPDARAITEELTTRRISLSLGGSVFDPTDAVGRLLFNVLAMVAEFESDLIRLRTREGMKVARAKGRLRGKQPKLNRRQVAHLLSLAHSGEYSILEVAECLVSAAQLCTAPSNANGSRRRPTSPKRRRDARASSWRRPFRIRHPSGTSAGRRRLRPLNPTGARSWLGYQDDGRQLCPRRSCLRCWQWKNLVSRLGRRRREPPR